MQITIHITPSKPQLVEDSLCIFVQTRRWTVGVHIHISCVLPSHKSIVVHGVPDFEHLILTVSLSSQESLSRKLVMVCLIHSTDVNVSHDLSTVLTESNHTDTHTHTQ